MVSNGKALNWLHYPGRIETLTLLWTYAIHGSLIKSANNCSRRKVETRSHRSEGLVDNGLVSPRIFIERDIYVQELEKIFARFTLGKKWIISWAAPPQSGQPNVISEIAEIGSTGKRF